MATAKKSQSTEIAEKKNTQMVAADSYAEYANQGFDGQTQADISIPFLNLLQGLSPKVSEDPKNFYAGMMMDSVSEETFDGDEGVLFVPAYTQHHYIEYVPRDSGGGFVGVHALDSDVVRNAKASPAEGGKLKVGNNELIETFNVYGVRCDEDSKPVSMMVLSITSTKIKAYRAWNTRMKTFLLQLANGNRINPPMYANLTRIKSKKVENNKGVFYVFDFSPAIDRDMKASLLPTTSDAFIAAKECYEVVRSGIAKADYNSADNSGGNASEEEHM